MSPSTRNVLIGSTSVVVVGLCVGLVAYYAGAVPKGGAHAELVYIPADVSVVAFADVRSIMDSEFRQKLRQALPTGSEKNRLFEETGIDLEHDIDSVVAGVKGTRGPEGGVVLFRGRFDQARIEALALGKGARQEQYGGVAMLVGLTPPPSERAIEGREGHVPALAFLDSDLLALGDANGVRAAIDAAASRQSVVANADLMRAIGTVEGTGNAWLVGRANDLLEQHNHVSDQVRGHLEGIEWLTVSAHIDRDVRGVVRADTRDEQAGQQLRSVVAGLLMAAKTFGGQQPIAAEALSSLQVTGAGPTAELSFHFSGNLLDKLSALAPEPQLPAPPR